MNKKGFTLIELMIILVIIAIITSISYITYSNVKKSARDAQRKSDLATIARALGEFKSDHGQYPHAFSTNKSFSTEQPETDAFNLLENGGEFYYLGDYCNSDYNTKIVGGDYLDSSDLELDYYYFAEFVTSNIYL